MPDRLRLAGFVAWTAAVVLGCLASTVREPLHAPFPTAGATAGTPTGRRPGRTARTLGDAEPEEADGPSDGPRCTATIRVRVPALEQGGNYILQYENDMAFLDPPQLGGAAIEDRPWRRGKQPAALLRELTRQLEDGSWIATMPGQAAVTVTDQGSDRRSRDGLPLERFSFAVRAGVGEAGLCHQASGRLWLDGHFDVTDLGSVVGMTFDGGALLTETLCPVRGRGPRDVVGTYRGVVEAIVVGC